VEGVKGVTSTSKAGVIFQTNTHMGLLYQF